MPGKQKGKLSNLLTVPSPEADDKLVNLADWVEVRSLLESDGHASQEDLVRALLRDYSMVESTARSLAGDVFKELADRRRSCIPMSGKGDVWDYPFELNDSGNLLSCRAKPTSRSRMGTVYIFMLIASRADMDSRRRTLGGLDPTQVFERLCADILLSFWGGKTEYSGSLVFGTARKKSGHNHKFESNIEELCLKLQHEGGMKIGEKPPGAGDGKLDVVVWRVFPDRRAGGLFGFGQCKTGIHWKTHLTKLEPREFCRRYFQQPLIIDPVRVYMVPHRVNGSDWDHHTGEGGLLFDRCRLVQYGYDVSSEVLNECRDWLNAALDQQKKGIFAL